MFKIIAIFQELCFSFEELLQNVPGEADHRKIINEEIKIKNNKTSDSYQLCKPL